MYCFSVLDVLFLRFGMYCFSVLGCIISPFWMCYFSVWMFYCFSPFLDVSYLRLDVVIFSPFLDVAPFFGCTKSPFGCYVISPVWMCYFSVWM